jgi:hypothetical protein
VMDGKVESTAKIPQLVWLLSSSKHKIMGS